MSCYRRAAADRALVLDESAHEVNDMMRRGLAKVTIIANCFQVTRSPVETTRKSTHLPTLWAREAHWSLGIRAGNAKISHP